MATDARRLVALVLLGSLALPSTGCTRGFLFTYNVTPLTRNMNATPVGSRQVSLDLHRIKEPITEVNIEAQWNSNAIGEAARVAGLKKIYYADLRTLSILGGIYRNTTILVSGD